jgi:hypothetical protein
MTAATGLAAMSVSCARGDRHVNGSARMRAGARWNVSGSGSGAGAGGAAGFLISAERGRGRGSRERLSQSEMSLTY